jgi:hypothetical protein
MDLLLFDFATAAGPKSGSPDHNCSEQSECGAIGNRGLAAQTGSRRKDDLS